MEVIEHSPSFSSQHSTEFRNYLKNYPIHELCMYFPWMDQQIFKALKKDLKKYGQRDTIKRYNGKILDGKNRLFACFELGITPRIEDLPEDTDIIAYVKAVGLHRRDLSPTQRIEIALELEEYRKEHDGKKEVIEALKKDPIQKEFINHSEDKRIAREASSNEETVKKVRQIKEKATHDKKAQQLLEDARQNKISVDQAYQRIKRRKKKEQKKTIENTLEPPSELELITEEVKHYKSEVAYLQTVVKRMITKFKELALWDEVKKELFPIQEVRKNNFPTIQQLREAELI